MNFKSLRKRITQIKKKPRSKKAALRVRIERTVGVVLVVLMGGAAIMVAARRPVETTVVPAAMTSKAVAPPTATATMPAKKAGAKAAHSPEAIAAANASPVTITGCLERDDDAFKLKDTEGADAPTSRSWKSGFLKKRPAAVTVLDTSNRLKLDRHVGERVSVTGPMIDREMQVRSLSRVTPSCG